MFLQSDYLTIPTETHDYPEWHKGREDYALWYVEIDHPELFAYLNQLRQTFANYLYQPNTRQFHITLFICGFLTDQQSQFDDDFIIQKFQQQVKLLVKNNLNIFQLKTGQIQSFESALFVEIFDIENSLSNIRSLFSRKHLEISALDYCPHITLGLYSKAFESSEIFAKIQQIPQQYFNISVDHLTFGLYKAKILQGQLYPYQQVHLMSQHVELEDF